MRVEDFFAKYANTKLEKRIVALNIIHLGLQSLNDYYFRLRDLEDAMRPLIIERDKLLEEIESYLN